MFSAIKLIFDITNKKGLRKQYPKQQRSAYNSLIYTLLSAIMISILMEYPLVVPVHYMWPINIGLLIFIFIFYRLIIAILNKKQVLIHQQMYLSAIHKHK